MFMGFSHPTEVTNEQRNCLFVVPSSCSSITTEGANEPQICKCQAAGGKRVTGAQDSALDRAKPPEPPDTGERNEEERESGEPRDCQAHGARGWEQGEEGPVAGTVCHLGTCF